MKVLLAFAVVLSAAAQDAPAPAARVAGAALVAKVREKYLAAKTLRIKGRCDSLSVEWIFKDRRYRIDAEGRVPGSADKAKKTLTWICDGKEFMRREREADGQGLTQSGPATPDQAKETRRYLLEDGRLPLPDDDVIENKPRLKSDEDATLDDRKVRAVTFEQDDLENDGAVIVNCVFIEPESLTIAGRTISRVSSDGRWVKTTVLSQQRYAETAFDAGVDEALFAIPRK